MTGFFSNLSVRTDVLFFCILGEQFLAFLPLLLGIVVILDPRLQI